jgi:PmbA protein
MGQALFDARVQIIDDPHMPRALGSKPFDAEGVRGERRAIVKDGALTTWLLDVRSANKLGLQTTGHASRGLASPPGPSSSNLYMAAGEVSPQALIGEIENGFYVTETFGMGVNLVTGDYSQGASGLWIEKGQLAYPVSEVTIAGHLGEMFAQLAPADDLVFQYASNVPTLRIGRMTIAGA